MRHFNWIPNAENKYIKSLLIFPDLKKYHSSKGDDQLCTGYPREEATCSAWGAWKLFTGEMRISHTPERNYVSQTEKESRNISGREIKSTW